MTSFNIQFKGAAELIERIEKGTQDFQAQAQAVLQNGAEKIADKAKQNAPGANDKVNSTFGHLHNQISSKRIDDYNYEVTSGAEYSAYVEFGTGDRVQIPAFVEGLPDLTEFAMQFFVTGKGHGPAQPFFFPAVVDQQPEIIDEIRKLLDQI